MKSLYQTWGFTQNPFNVTALPASGLGSQLLIGRDEIVTTIHQRLCDPPKAITLEGPNGVGKTSIANVAVFQAQEQFKRGETEFLFALAPVSLQLASDDDVETFLDKVYFSVAQTLLSITNDPGIARHGAKLKNQASIDKWLNFAEQKGWSAGIPWFSAGKSSSTNTSDGFARSGFRKVVEEWLNDFFPEGEGGGIVCVLDNLELLQQSKSAREKIEQLRDPVLSLSGVRWILCGASGIVRSIASTPRLEGILHAPIDISGVPDSKAEAILKSRVAAYSAFDRTPFLPISAKSFSALYSILRSNIRSALSHADNFCSWVAASKLEKDCEKDPDGVFLRWLKEEHEKVMSEVQKRVKKTAWGVFDKAVELGGQFAPGDYDTFGFNSGSALRTHILALEAVGLMKSAVDEDDSRRRSIGITSRGWMVHHARENGFETLFASEVGENDDS